MKKVFLISLFLIYFIQLFSYPEPDSLKSKSFTLGIGGNILMTYGFLINSGYSDHKQDIYVQYTKLNGYIKADIFELRLTYFLSNNKTGLSLGVGAGYADYRIESLLSSEAKTRKAKDITLCGEIGYSVRPGLKIGLDLGSKPGFLNLFISLKTI
ncbi:MAG: hypothetical protein JW996_01775 [Candidatus Cloacimonetes bacterium]|nr:hypothetical protein [Candidatus Cloacimonadota bacterium]